MDFRYSIDDTVLYNGEVFSIVERNVESGKGKMKKGTKVYKLRGRTLYEQGGYYIMEQIREAYLFLIKKNRL
jgi:hypothetical protein|tara:strand:+ start:619 stop:834 length:216 start_codon:yes stop_codon:yes gene_type:complete